MAKGQLRGNREAKKPKQAPKSTVPVSPLLSSIAQKSGAHGADAKKK